MTKQEIQAERERIGERQETMTHTYEISGDDFVAYQTKRIADLWGSSRPRPSNRRMGFRDHWEGERPPGDGKARRGVRWEKGRVN